MELLWVAIGMGSVCVGVALGLFVLAVRRPIPPLW